MRFLLQLKHWQLFTLTFGLSFIGSIIRLPIVIMQIAACLTMAGVFGWIWAIANVLHPKLPGGIGLSNWKFRMSLLLAVMIFAWLEGTLIFKTGEVPPSVLIVAILIYLALMVISVLHAAKTFKSVELKKRVTFAVYIGEAFLIWLSPIGIWLLQPRLNALVRSE